MTSQQTTGMTASSSKDAFADIYSRRGWGNGTPSGPGSEVKQNHKYLQTLKRVLAQPGISTVLDLGCGDWNLGRAIDWTGFTYIGVDVVQHLVDGHQSTYGTNSISFQCLDLENDALPAADIVILKDVLQHLPNKAVRRVLQKVRNYRYALITNDWIRHKVTKRWRYFSSRRRYGPKPNSDIDYGQWRPIRVTESPFDLKAKRLATYQVRCGVDILDTKEILLARPRERKYWHRYWPAS